MPRWFLVLFLLSLVGFAASWSGDLVLFSTMMTRGVMLPVWYLAANLWWVLLALMPFMVLRGRVRGALALVLGLGPVIALGVGALAMLHAARAGLTPALPLPPPGLALEAGPPRSVEVVFRTAGGPDDGEAACGRLCRALLTGPDVNWFRLYLGDVAIVFARRDRQDCLALDTGFPVDAPCLLARQDDGAAADLRIEVTQEGSHHAPIDPEPGLVGLTFRQRLTLTDTRADPPRLLDERLRYAWSEPVPGVIVPGMRALGSGARDDGPNLMRRDRQSEPFDLAAILTHAGLRLGPVPEAGDDGRRAAVPADTTLLVSILDMAPDGTLSRDQSQLARDWVRQFRPSQLDKTEVPKVGEVERRIMQRLMALGGDRELERSLTLLLADHPEYFVEDFGTLLRVIVTGAPEEAEKASNAARLALFHAERGVHDAAWPDYVAAIESGRADPDLIRMVGRFNQNPLPLLQGQLTRTPTDHFAWAALKAVCTVDPRWWPELIPFFHEAALGYLPRAGDTKMNTMEIHHAVRALAFMDRRDLAADVVSRIDWSQVAQMPKWARNPPALADYRQRTSELPDLPTGC